MAIGNHNDLTHIVRTSDQWKNTYDKYELIPTGVLCVELVSSDVTKIKIGDGHNIFSKLPYIGDLDLSKYYTKLETDTRIKEILTQEKVIRIKGILGSKSDLPADARCGDIYFVRQLSSSDNKYIEYIYSPDNTWEPLGGIPVDIDLSEYAKTAYVDDKIEQVNERIDDIEQHGTHTHPNKEILDQITEPYTTADKETLASLHNYDDTEIREMISQSSHTHTNKDILDATSAAFTKEDKSKLDQLNPYDDSILKEKITALERLAHEHSNKRILDRTTASFTTEYERKMRWIRIYTGCTGMEEGIAGLVPAAQAGEEDYVLSGSGEWVPQTGGGGTYELPIATATTLGGIKVGSGLEIDANGVLSATGGGGGDSIDEGDGITITTDPQTGVKTISVDTGNGLQINQDGEVEIDPSIIPDVKEYQAGTAISIEDVEHGGVTFDAWNSGTGWENICYADSTGNSVVNYQYEAHSPISNSYTLPTGATHIRAIAYDQNDTMLWTSFSWIDSNNYHFASTSPDVFDDWFEIPSGAVKVNFGVRHSKLNTSQAMSLNDIKSVDITVQTVGEIEVDVWNGGTGWTNGDYYSGDSDNFTTNWYYTYHYNPSEYIQVPEGATHVMVQGISNENDSHFEGGGVNVFNSDHSHHTGWWACAWEWHELTSDVGYIQPEVKWNNNNTRTISANDIKSITLVWKLPTLETNQAINVKYGDGLTVNQNNELEVNLGSGLAFDANGAIEVTGGTGGDSVTAGDAIDITTDSQTGDKIISVNYGEGLTIDPVTGALMFDGQLPEGTIIKKMTYMGDDNNSRDITFDKKPIAILNIYGAGINTKVSACAAPIDAPVLNVSYGDGSNHSGMVTCNMSYNDSTNTLTLSGGIDAGARCNMSGETYTMFYLTKGHTGSGTSATNEVSVVKTFSYVGTGTATNNIQFPETPDYILSISGPLGSIGDILVHPIDIEHPTITSQYMFQLTQNNTSYVGRGTYTFSDSTNILSLIGADYGGSLNYTDNVYYVRYIVNETIGVPMDYQAGEAIDINAIVGSIPTAFSNNDFIASITRVNAGNIVKAADNSYFTLTASNDDCYTTSSDASGSYAFTVKPSTSYRLSWDSSDTSINGMVILFENQGYTIMHSVDQAAASYIDFTTDSSCRFFTTRFGITYAGNSITFSNIQLVEIIDDTDAYNEISVKYAEGLEVNNLNELKVKLGSGLQFDANGAIAATGGGGGSGDTVAQGNGINITTDQQTGDKVIAVNAGTGLQFDQTTHELEPKLGDGLEFDEYNAITVDPFYPNTLILNCVLDDEPSSDLILHFTLDPDE